MKFTDRFLKLPTLVYNGALSDREESMGLPAHKELYPSWVKIPPSLIENYGPDINFETYVEDQCFIRTKSGDTYKIPITVEELEKRLNEFEK